MTDHELTMAFSLMGTKLAGYGKNKVAKCPLAPWTHPKGKDKNPSITAKADTRSLFRCWACGKQGTVLTLAKLYASYSGDSQAFQYVQGIEGGKSSGASMILSTLKHKGGYNAYNARKGAQIQEKAKQIITEETIAKFCENVPTYALDRGMTKDQINRWEIGYDAIEKRMTFTIRDYKGKLCGVSGRDLTDTQDSKYKHYYGFKKELVLFGERFLDIRAKKIYLVEGFFDVFAMERYGFKNVFASMGTSLSFDQLKNIRDWCDEVIFLPDGDLPGLKFAEEQGLRIFLQCKKKVRIAGIAKNDTFVKRDNLSGNWGPTDYRFKLLDGLVGKDPADWTQDDLRLAMSNSGYFTFGPGGIVHEFGGGAE